MIHNLTSPRKLDRFSMHDFSPVEWTLSPIKPLLVTYQDMSATIAHLGISCHSDYCTDPIYTVTTWLMHPRLGEYLKENAERYLL